MKSFRLHKLFFFCAFLTVSQGALGVTQFRVMSGTKTQSYNKGSQDQIGTSPLGLITFIDFQATEKFYFSFGTSFEMSTETYSTSGFTIYGSAMYYLYGAPGMVESDTENMKMNLFYPYSVYASAGIFQKQIKIRSIDSEDSTITKDLGGLQAGVGFNYNLNAKIYLTSHLQMLMSGMGSSSEYSSTEFYIGLGLRL